MRRASIRESETESILTNALCSLLCCAACVQFYAQLQFNGTRHLWRRGGLKEDKQEHCPPSPTKTSHSATYIPQASSAGAAAAGGSPIKQKWVYKGPLTPTKKTKTEDSNINLYIDQNLSTNQDGEDMGPGLPLSNQHGFDTLKDHLKSNKTLFNQVLGCKWQPAEDGGIARWRTKENTDLLQRDLLKYLAPEELMRVKTAVNAVGSKHKKEVFADIEAWLATLQ